MDYSVIKKLVDEDIIQSQPNIELVRDKLKILVDTGFLNSDDENRFEFQDQVSWEIVYETLLYAERRHLHDLIAKHIEKNNKTKLDEYAARLVFHYEKAENEKKLVYYSALAGEHAFNLFAIEDAINFYRKSLVTIQRITKYPVNDLCFLNEKLADIMESTGDFPQAIQLYNLSLELLDDKTTSRRTFLPWKIALPKKKSQIYQKVAVAYERSLDYTESLKYLAMANDALPARPGILQAKINATQAVVYFRKTEFDNSLIFANKSLQDACKRKSFSDAGYAYNIIANVYKTTGKLADAAKHFKKALTNYEITNDINGIAMSSFNMAVVLTHLGDLDDADFYYEKSLNINKQMQNKLALMQDYFMRANTRMNLRDYENAMDYYGHAIDIYENGLRRNDIYGACLARIAEIYSENNDVSHAEIYIDKSLKILNSIGQHTEFLGQAKIILTQIKLKQKKLDEAEIICNEISHQFHEMRMVPYELFAMRLLAMIYRDMNRYDLAKEVLNKALNLTVDMNSTYDQKCVQNLIYDVSVRSGDYPEDIREKVESLLALFTEKNDYHEMDIAKNVLSIIG
jgi:tetratricopeptide (TPR) repeat protein